VDGKLHGLVVVMIQKLVQVAIPIGVDGQKEMVIDQEISLELLQLHLELIQ